MTKRTPKPLHLFAAPVLALGLALPLATSPALAGQDTQIEVTSERDMKQWKKTVSRQLDRALAPRPGNRALQPQSGIVQIAFEVDAQGKPENLKLKTNSANKSAARLAMQAVKRINNMDEAPLSDVSEARFLANIIFADTYAEREELSRTLEKSERARLASGNAEDEVIVLGG